MRLQFLIFLLRLLSRLFGQTRLDAPATLTVTVED